VFTVGQNTCSLGHVTSEIKENWVDLPSDSSVIDLALKVLFSYYNYIVQNHKELLVIINAKSNIFFHF